MWLFVACRSWVRRWRFSRANRGAGFDFRSDVGNWSRLWPVMPRVLGYQFRQAWAGALAGLAATMSALVGFYVMNAVLFPKPWGLG